MKKIVVGFTVLLVACAFVLAGVAGAAVFLLTVLAKMRDD